MARLLSIFIAVTVLALLALVGCRTFDGARHAQGVSVAVPLQPAKPLPLTPDSWHGRVDYAALDAQLTAMAQRPEMAGLAIAVVEDGELRFVRSYGVADASTGAPVTPETLFRWASVSKTATGTLAATMAENGTVNLNQPLDASTTSLRLPGGAERQISLLDLLSQRTGLTRNAYDDKLEQGIAADALRRSLVAAPLQCAPGTCHTYQNIAFDAASEILSAAGRKPFGSLVEDRLFMPLGMTSAGYGMDRLVNAKDWARPHRGRQVRPVKPAYWNVPAAAGVESNIVDFATWMQAMMGERPDVLPQSVLRLAHRPRVLTGQHYGGPLRQAITDAAYGLGWRSFNYDGHQIEGHSGAVEGYRATMLFEPATRTGVVVLWNSDWGLPFRIPFMVFDSYHRRPDMHWLDLSNLPPVGNKAAGPMPYVAAADGVQ